MGAPISYFWIKLEQLAEGQAGNAHLSENMCFKVKEATRMNSRN